MSDYETSVAINTMAIEFLKMKNEAFWAKVQGYGATLRPNKFMLYLRPDVMDFVDFDELRALGPFEIDGIVWTFGYEVRNLARFI